MQVNKKLSLFAAFLLFIGCVDSDIVKNNDYPIKKRVEAKIHNFCHADNYNGYTRQEYLDM